MSLVVHHDGRVHSVDDAVEAFCGHAAPACPRALRLGSLGRSPLQCSAPAGAGGSQPRPAAPGWDADALQALRVAAWCRRTPQVRAGGGIGRRWYRGRCWHSFDSRFRPTVSTIRAGALTRPNKSCPNPSHPLPRIWQAPSPQANPLDPTLTHPTQPHPTQPRPTPQLSSVLGERIKARWLAGGMTNRAWNSQVARGRDGRQPGGRPKVSLTVALHTACRNEGAESRRRRVPGPDGAAAAAGSYAARLQPVVWEGAAHRRARRARDARVAGGVVGGGHGGVCLLIHKGCDVHGHRMRAQGARYAHPSRPPPAPTAFAPADTGPGCVGPLTPALLH
jgi:hypothetical protein